MEPLQIFMKATPNISIILPFFNAGDYLKKCIRTVLDQSMTNIELILINDGSTDFTPEVALNFSIQDSRVNLVELKKNKGVSFCRNLGIKLAKGEFISFIDADDFYPDKTVLEHLYCEAIRTKSEIVGGSLLVVNSDALPISYKIPKQYFLTKQKLTYRDYQHDGGFYRFIYSRNILLEKKILFPYLSRFQDPVFFFRALTRVNHFMVIPNYVYAYRKGHKTIIWTHKKAIDHLAGVIYLLKKSSLLRYKDLHLLMIKNSSRTIIYRTGSFTFVKRYTLVNKILHEIDMSIANDLTTKFRIFFYVSILFIAPILSILKSYKEVRI